jgi:hypothetical protein
VREYVDELGEGRPLGTDIERLTREALESGRLLKRVHDTMRA